MDVREALYTTRAMRRVKPDPIPQEVVSRVLDAAIRAPSGGNMQTWKFLVITDEGVRAKLAPIYKEGLARQSGGGPERRTRCSPTERPSVRSGAWTAPCRLLLRTAGENDILDRAPIIRKSLVAPAVP